MSNFITIPKPASPKLGDTQVFTVPNHANLQGFVIYTGSQFRAYLNKCRHWPIPLDFDDAEFFHPEFEKISCKTHGALYNLDSGICEAGPCSGSSLYVFELIEDSKELRIRIPDENVF